MPGEHSQRREECLESTVRRNEWWQRSDTSIRRLESRLLAPFATVVVGEVRVTDTEHADRVLFCNATSQTCGRVCETAGDPDIPYPPTPETLRLQDRLA